MYVTSPQDNAVKVRDLTGKGSGLTTLVQDRSCGGRTRSARDRTARST